jgi:hypothetical protein
MHPPLHTLSDLFGRVLSKSFNTLYLVPSALHDSMCMLVYDVSLFFDKVMNFNRRN